MELDFIGIRKIRRDKMKKSFLILAMLIISLSFAVYAMDTPVINKPATGGSLGNNSPINITFGTGGDVDYCVVYAKSANTRNTTFSKVVNITNSTATDSNSGHLNASYSDSFRLDEGNNFHFGAVCYNNSDLNTSTSNSTGVLIDLFKTTAPTGITFSNPIADGGTITATINLDNAHRCFVRFGGTSVPRKTMTLSGSTCTFTVGKNNPPNSDYQTFIEADDETNSTLSTQQNVIIRAVASDGGGLFSGATLQVDNQANGQSAIGGNAQNPFAPKKDDKIILLVVVLAGAFLYFKNKKG